MRHPLSPPLGPAVTPPLSLWQQLGPGRPQQLAQCLAGLIRRLRQAADTHGEENLHERP